MSMLCLLKKVLLSSGVSMLDGCGIGSHIKTAQVSGGSLKPHSPLGGQLLYIFRCPVQCSTLRGNGNPVSHAGGGGGGGVVVVVVL